MQSYQNALASNTTGLPISGASVEFKYYPSGASAVIYSTNDITKTMSNPVATAPDGSFYAFLKNGWYTITITVGALAPVTGQPFFSFDPTDTDGTITNTWASPGAIGATTPNSGAFTNISASGSITGAIGGITPAAGAFTTISASSTVSGAGFTNYFASPPPIGGTSANSAYFTTVNFIAGTATRAPLIFASGPVLTAASAGAAEFDGNAFYLTPVTSNRGVVSVEHLAALTADWTGQNVATAQPWLNTTANGAITLAANTTYLFEGVLALGTTGTTSHSLSLLFGGTATITSIGYTAAVTQNATSITTLGTDNHLYGNVATAVQVTASAATATYNVAHIKGIVRINAAGTFIPQFQYSAAPGVAPTIYANSFFSLRPIGNGSVGTVGNWS